MLRLSPQAHLSMIGHAYDGLPDEACGLLVGRLDDETAPSFEPCRNAAASSRIYTIDPRDHLRIDRAAEDQGMEIVGVMHSHTHSAPYPSPTDVEQAFVPEWHYVIVSLRDTVPSLRSYRIIDGTVTEEPVVVDLD